MLHIVARYKLPDSIGESLTSGSTTFAKAAETSLPAAAERATNAFDPRAARVHQLILENKSAKEIIGEIWGTASGDSYRKANAEYQAIVRQLVRH